MVVGHYNGHIALAAVGSTSALNSLIIGVFMGLAVGAGVCAAQYIGAKDYEKVGRVVHTSILLSIILGASIGAVAFAFAPQLLTLMDTPENVIAHSTLYIRIIFCGFPANLLYNYCAAILRSSGDTKHPLIFLTVSGVVNVLLNIFMVSALDMGVAGVAVATVASQVLSAVLIVVYMARSEGYLKIRLNELRISGEQLSRILAIGIPTGIQGSLFSLTNVLIQSSINSFGDIVVAGNSAAVNIETFIFTASNSVHQAAVTFTGQNVGAKKYGRIGKVALACAGFSAIFCMVFGVLMYFLKTPLIGLYASGDDAVIRAGITRISIVAITYFLGGIQDSICGVLRGMGQSLSSMIVSLLAICGFRILWLQTVFKVFNTPISIYVTYPISWMLSLLGNLALFLFIYRKTLKNNAVPELHLHLHSRKNN